MIQCAHTPHLTIAPGNDNGTYYLGEKIYIEVHFSDNVTVKGNPKFFMEVGGGSTFPALYLIGSEKAVALVFIYTVEKSHVSQDLKYSWEQGQKYQFSGGEIIDSRTNKKAVLVLPEPGSTGSLSANKDFKIRDFSKPD